MRDSKIRHCIVCGNEYEYCPRCGADRNKPVWMINFDKIECLKAMDLFTDYEAGIISKEDAKVKFEEIGMDANKLKESMKNTWNEINATEEYVEDQSVNDEVEVASVEEIENTPNDSNVQEEVIEEIAEEIAEQPVVATTTKVNNYKSSNKNYYKNYKYNKK